MVLLYVISGFCFSLPGLIGWTNNIYDHKMLQCMWNRTHNIPYTVFFSLVIVFLPTCLIGASFIKIYIHVRASRKRIEGKTLLKYYLFKEIQAWILYIVNNIIVLYFIILSGSSSAYSKQVLIQTSQNTVYNICHLYLMLDALCCSGFGRLA